MKRTLVLILAVRICCIGDGADADRSREACGQTGVIAKTTPKSPAFKTCSGEQ